MSKKKPRRTSRRTLPALKRKPPSKTVGTTHWVFCEGKTEKDCIDRLRQASRLASVQVVVVGQAGVPSTIVDMAAKKRKELSRSRNKHLKSDIYVVFDRDEHPCFGPAIDRARTLNFTIGVSVPCFELWAVLLHQDQTASIHRVDAQKLLKSLHPNYCHNRNPLLDTSVVVANRTQAASRASVLATRAAQAGDEFSNPSTTFHLVLDKIFE